MLIPKSIDVAGAMLFSLMSTVDRVTYMEDVEVTDMGTSELYYRMEIALPEGLPVGEYEYKLTADGSVLSSGLMWVGELSGSDEYQNTITYEQYETNE